MSAFEMEKLATAIVNVELLKIADSGGVEREPVETPDPPEGEKAAASPEEES